MNILTTKEFADRAGIAERVARKAFNKGVWRGFNLPVYRAAGACPSGKVWALALDRCPEGLKAKLGVLETPVEAPVQGALKGAVAPWQWDQQEDRLRIIAPILDTPKRTPERAEAFRSVAGQSHLIRGVPTQLAENTCVSACKIDPVGGVIGIQFCHPPQVSSDHLLLGSRWSGS